MAMHLLVVVPGAPVDGDICLAGPGKVQRLAVEATLLNCAREQYDLCVSRKYHGRTRKNLTCGVYVWDGLVYDRKVVTIPMEFSMACITSAQSYADIKLG